MMEGQTGYKHNPIPVLRQKKVEKVIAFVILSSEEIDASRFSGTEHSFYCAPLISPFVSTIDFSTPIRSIWTPRSIEVLENDRKNHSGRSTFTRRNRHIAVFGDRTNFQLRAVDFSFRFENRFFDADSIDSAASIDRGARK